MNAPANLDVAAFKEGTVTFRSMCCGCGWRVGSSPCGSWRSEIRANARVRLQPPVAAQSHRQCLMGLFFWRAPYPGPQRRAPLELSRPRGACLRRGLCRGRRWLCGPRAPSCAVAQGLPYSVWPQVAVWPKGSLMLDFPAFGAVVVLSLVLMRSTRESSLLNLIMVILHLVLILFVVCAGEPCTVVCAACPTCGPRLVCPVCTRVCVCARVYVCASPVLRAQESVFCGIFPVCARCTLEAHKPVHCVRGRTRTHHVVKLGALPSRSELLVHRSQRLRMHARVVFAWKRSDRVHCAPDPWPAKRTGACLKFMLGSKLGLEPHGGSMRVRVCACKLPPSRCACAYRARLQRAMTCKLCCMASDLYCCARLQSHNL